MLFSFAVGVAVGNAMWGNCNWGGGNVNVNVNDYNNFNRTNVQNGNWQHNAEHRKGVAVPRQAAASSATAAGSARACDSREQFRGRAEQGRQDISRGGGADNFQGGGNRQGDFGNRASQQPSAAAGHGGGRERGRLPGHGQRRADARFQQSRRVSSRFGGLLSVAARGAGARAAAAVVRVRAAARGGGGGGGRGGGGGGERA